MPILIILALLKRNMARNYVFLNFCFTWIVYSITFCLLLYAGQQTGPKPSWKICRTQAALVYAVPILVASASLALVFQLWLDIRSSVSKAGSRTFFSLRNLLLLGLPYVLFCGYLIGPSIVAITARKTISRENNYFYCSSNLRALTVISAASVGIIFLVTVTFEVLIARLIAERNIQQLQSGFFIRISIFTSYLLISLAACGLEIAQPSNPIRIIIGACGPLVVFIVFGSNPALYRPNPRPVTSTSATSTSTMVSMRASGGTDVKTTKAYYHPVASQSM